MADITPAKAITMGADAIYLKHRPPPDAPTGYYDWQITSDPSNNREGHSAVTNLVNRVEAFEAKGGFKPDPRDVAGFVDTVVNPTAVDDRKGFFTKGLDILARLDPDTALAKKLNNDAINTLQADGGGNNLENPDLGRAGTPYARSVQGRAGLPRTSLPDPGLIFDSILQKKGVQPHPGGMSSLIFAFATIVTHSLFRTDHKNIHINNASSYLDLSPLYGDNQAAQDKVRDKASGRGLLFPDTFSEERLLFLPPAASVLLVLFSRNHNYVAQKILKINERRLWSDPPPTDADKRAIQDEQIFQTAKLINCGHFMSAIMGDYVASFLGSSEGQNWNLKAFDVIKTKDAKVGRGLGNHVSVEFNVLYRWHSTTSEKDQKWTEDVFNSAFGGKPFDKLGLQDIATVAKILASVPVNPAERTFAGLKRGSDGKFSDEDLAQILYSATESPAGSFRGRGTPTVLRVVEIMGIEQSRAWGVCTMNEFRRYLDLKEFETFEEWNPDPEIAGAARRLYGHIDNLELYTGLQAESMMPLTDSFRFGCGYTTTRGVLGDAIALVRGDRFYTSDFTPTNLTTWGFHDCQRDMNNGGKGGQIPKLLIRHLPRHYPWNSIYSLYPFFTPSKMKASLTRQKLDHKYTFDHPVTEQPAKILNTFTGINAVFSDPTRFKVIYPYIGYGSILNFDDKAQHDNDRALVLHAFFPEKESMDQYNAWFAAATRAKIQEKSFKYPNVPGNYVDVVRDVINNVCAHHAAEKWLGIELKTKENPSGMYTENEFFDMFTALFSVNTLLPVDEPEARFALEDASDKAGKILGALTAKSIMEISPSSSPNFLGKVTMGAASWLWPPSKKECYPFLSRMAASGRPIDQLIGLILGVAIGATRNYAHAAILVVDFYLDEARAKEKAHIIELVNKKDAQSVALLRGYVSEVMRLNPQFPGLWRGAVADAQIPQGPGLPPIEIKAGDRIWASFVNAKRNPLDFPDPMTATPRRPPASYSILNGAGFHNCPGTSYSQQTITEIVKAIFSLKNIRRAPGDAGRMHRITEIYRETPMDLFVQRNGTVSAWPSSFQIVYDD